MNWIPALLATTLLFGEPRAVGAQAPTPAPPPLTQSLQTLNTLLARVPNASLALNFTEFRVRVVVSRLQALAANWPAQSPEDYRANLDRHVRTLQQALAANDVSQLAALLEAMADDLEVKLEHCQNSGGKLGGSVVVRVRTVRGDEEVRNWQVFYLPKVLEAVGVSSADRFPQLSSPTHETLVPGRYVMWVRDSSSDSTGERIVVKVGEGRKELVLDLPIPAGTTR
jgi:hypothetical protein